MTSALGSELKAAFETATEFVEPPSGLAERARLGARKRRRRRLLSATSAVATVALIATAGTYLGRTRPPASPAPGTILLPSSDQVTQLATSGRYLYVVNNQVDTLAAYNTVTGKLVRRITVPNTPGALAIGPGGEVWLSFSAAQSAGPQGIWLLSPDLRVHSGLEGGSGQALVPVSQTSAWVPAQGGLYRVTMPAPGAPGRGNVAYSPLAPRIVPMTSAPGYWAGLLDGRVVAQVTNGLGFDSHLVVEAGDGFDTHPGDTGLPRISYGGRAADQVGYVAQVGDSLWVQTYALHGKYAANSGPLVRLDSTLHPTTPAAVLASPVLAKTQDVWTSGDTVWAATTAPGHSLVCFSAGSRIGPITTVLGRGQAVALAATRDTVYISTFSPVNYLSGVGSGVISYRIPPACR